MTKFQAPNEHYTGVSAGVAFVNGQGETDDPVAIEYLVEKGYTPVDGEPSEKSLGSLNKQALLELVAAEGVEDVTEANTKAEIVAAIEAKRAE